MSKDELTEEDVMKHLEECNESQDIHGFCYIPEIVCSKILDLYQKEKEKNKDLWKAYLDVSNDRDNNYIRKDKVKALFYKKRGIVEREELKELLEE